MSVLKRKTVSAKGVDLTEMSDPIWEVQEGETANAFRCFIAYRDVPPSERSVLNAYIAYSKTDRDALRTSGVRDSTGLRKPQAPTHWRDLCRWWHWVERAKAHDVHLDRQRRQRIEEARNRVADRLAEHALDLVDETIKQALTEEMRTEIGAILNGPTAGRARLLTYLLDPLMPAKETATSRVELTGLDGQPIQTDNHNVNLDGPLDAETALEVAAILRDHGALEHAISDGDQSCDEPSTQPSSRLRPRRLRRSGST
jgi:hypothetical protein